MLLPPWVSPPCRTSRLTCSSSLPRPDAQRRESSRGLREPASRATRRRRPCPGHRAPTQGGRASSRVAGHPTQSLLPPPPPPVASSRPLRNGPVCRPASLRHVRLATSIPGPMRHPRSKRFPPRPLPAIRSSFDSWVLSFLLKLRRSRSASSHAEARSQSLGRIHGFASGESRPVDQSRCIQPTVCPLIEPTLL